MKTIILFFIFLYSQLLANCSLEEIKLSDRLYAQANQESNPQKQIKLLQDSLKNCYAPEIEASLFILQAQNSIEKNQKIEFYKKSLVPISNFQDTQIALKYQCEINTILSNLYEDIDDEVSIIYKNKVLVLCGKEEKDRNYFWVILFFIILLVWGVCNSVGCRFQRTKS
jgi:hypothetical protein